MAVPVIVKFKTSLGLEFLSLFMSNYWQKLFQNISPGLQKIFKNFSWLLAERLLNMVLALTIGVYMIRYLGAQQFGVLSFAFSFVNIFDGLSRFGLDSLVIRNLVNQENKSSPILGSSFFIKGVTILGCIIISIILFQRINQDVTSQKIMLIIAFSLVFNAFDVIDFWFQSRLLSQPMVLVRGTQVILSAGLKLIFIHYGLSVMAFAYLYLVEGLTRMVGMLIAYHQYRQSWRSWRWDWAIAKELLQDAWPLA
ncbi:MAG: oligosaccharide flippase family protein, partial [Microcystaceae cyanobacterium]